MERKAERNTTKAVRGKALIAEARRIIRNLWRLSVPKKNRQKEIDDLTAEAFQHFLAHRKPRRRHAS